MRFKINKALVEAARRRRGSGQELSDNIIDLYQDALCIAADAYPEHEDYLFNIPVDTADTKAIAYYDAAADKVHLSNNAKISKDTEFILTTLLHELAHAIVWKDFLDSTNAAFRQDGRLYLRFGHTKYELPDPHGTEFKRVAKKLQKQGNIDRDFSSAHATEVPDDYKDAQRATAKYILYCPSCGHEWYQQRMCKSVQHPEMFSCRQCHVPLKLRGRD